MFSSQGIASIYLYMENSNLCIGTGVLQRFLSSHLYNYWLFAALYAMSCVENTAVAQIFHLSCSSEHCNKPTVYEQDKLDVLASECEERMFYWQEVKKATT